MAFQTWTSADLQSCKVETGRSILLGSRKCIIRTKFQHSWKEHNSIAKASPSFMIHTPIAPTPYPQSTVLWEFPCSPVEKPGACFLGRLAVYSGIITTFLTQVWFRKVVVKENLRKVQNFSLKDRPSLCSASFPVI